MPDGPYVNSGPPPAPGRLSRAGGVALAAGLTLLAGFVDAVAFQGFGEVFASFMSGNTTRLGIALAGHQEPRAVLFASVILMFVTGAAAGRAISNRGGRLARPAVLTLVGLLLAAAALAARLEASAAALILCVPAMGAQNAVIQRAGPTPVTLTYVTGTLVRTGEAIADLLMGRGGRDLPVYLLLWLGLGVGAVGGATAFARWGAQALAAPAALALILAALLALAGLAAPRRPRSAP